MSPRIAVTGWVLAAVFAATTVLFAWEYAEVRHAADLIRRDYETLQLRVEAQARQNKEFDATLATLTRQLNEAQAALEALDKAVHTAPPAQPAPSQP